MRFFEIRDFKIQRCFIYLDPDYESADVGRYPWLTSKLPNAALSAISPVTSER